jgi:hypothetical protein
MNSNSRLFLKFGLVCALFFAVVSSSVAGWFGFRNDTKGQVVVQETITVNGVARPGKPESLNSGDSVRDSQICPNNQRKFTIYDPKGNVLYTNTLPCPGMNENILYVIKTDTKGKITVEPVKSKK